ncbi:vWA domain-containing protein [Hyphomicrobium sp.]|uniref:vWA domain-containing protein n=1 Tax=Hyphomicrobium sp. TaxID=82 RepID=UPI002D77419B|nr:VWA domain-containing protein [Hyphomicrobium sp.]HET6390753.1 VWA domain-containing protein [Hyphomicrobium sp.]
MRGHFMNYVAAVIVAVFLMGGVQPALSGDAPTAMIVLDGSGSMWARLPPDNRAKIDIVRERLGALLSQPNSTRLGLVSFGHRRRGDCNDVELIAPPDSPRQAVLDPIAKLNPRGPGPLTAALKVAMGAIGQSRPAQVVFIGDGADNCQQDTCAVAGNLAKSFPGVAVQVIGIGVSAKERPRMACIAQSTGGRFYDVVNPEGLAAAINEATELAILSPGASVAGGIGPDGKPVAPPPPEGATLRASASLAETGPLLTGPLIKWRISKVGDAAPLAKAEGHDITAKLPAGSYEVTAELGALTAREEITIKDGDKPSIILAFNAAHLRARVSASKGGARSETAVLTVSRGDKPVTIASNGAVDLYLPPETYTLTAADGAARTSQTLQLAAGDDKPLDIYLGTGRVDLSAVAADGGEVQDVLFAVSADDPESPDGRREVARSRSPQASFTLPEGTYYVSARSRSGDVRKRIAVGAGQTVSEKLTLVLVPLKVSALVAGAPAKAGQNIFYRVERIDDDRTGIVRAMGPELSLDLSPGRYRVTASLAVSHISATKEFDVVAGKPANAVIDIAAGEVNFAPPSDGSAVAGDLFWEVSDDSGMPRWRATGMRATALLAPGRYTVRCEARGRHQQTSFEVRAGESQKIEIGPG